MISSNYKNFVFFFCFYFILLLVELLSIDLKKLTGDLRIYFLAPRLIVSVLFDY
jgi:hypothetical protein